jgi:prolyl oligopeptidase
MQLRRASLLFTLIAGLGGSAAAQQCPANGQGLQYPLTRTVAQQDNYHGTTVADPYRWLEDANSADTHAWVEA